MASGKCRSAGSSLALQAALFASACTLLAVPALAQVRELGDEQEENVVGRTAGTSGGTVGQRKEREDVTPLVDPIDRIDTRIENRIQSRLRLRIDRYYVPQRDAASPFENASEQLREAGRRPGQRR